MVRFDPNRLSWMCTYILAGSLVAGAKSDPNLTKYSHIIIDEAHQHSTATDVSLGILKEVTAVRDDLKVIIMSATMDTASFQAFFPNSVVESIEGREYGVEIRYLKNPVPSTALNDKIIRVVLWAHLHDHAGNILVFAPGVGDINTILEGVANALCGDDPTFDPTEAGPVSLFALYGAMTPEQQDEVVNAVPPPSSLGKPGRKIIATTNIAEASVTIAGVTIVIDSCRFKSKLWNPRNESHALRTQWNSKAQSKQRSGRAGRTSPGIAYRMCTQTGFYSQLTDFSVPEIQNSDMLRESIDIMRIGRNPLKFPYMAPPAPETLVKANGLLRALGAVTVEKHQWVLTSRGEEISNLPVDVCSAVVLLEAQKYGCSDEMVSMVSMIEATEGGTSLFFPIPKDPAVSARLRAFRNEQGNSHGDHIMLFNIYMSWRSKRETNEFQAWLNKYYLRGDVLQRAHALRNQLLKLLWAKYKKDKSWKPCALLPDDPQYYTKMICALATGYHVRVAKLVPGEINKYETVRQGAPAKLDRHTSLGSGSSEWVMYNEFDQLADDKSYLHLVTPIPLPLLLTARPDYWSQLDFAPPGHILDTLVQQICAMTGRSKEDVRGDMPPPSKLRTTAPK